jgi:uncharacterized protein YjiS (DUF1127 family)
MNAPAPALIFATPSQRVRQATADWLHTVVDALRQARRRNAARRTLQALDDRTLHDIGMHRAEIDSVVAEAMGDASATRRCILASRQATT